MDFHGLWAIIQEEKRKLATANIRELKTYAYSPLRLRHQFLSAKYKNV